MNQKRENQELRTVRGMRDLFGEDAELYRYIIEQITKIVLKNGYTPIETPILEFTSVFMRSLGEYTDVVSKEMFSFLDRSENSVSLRPEGTASIVRALITNKLTQTLPQKWFYHGPMFRYDRPQKGRYRQFYQFGVEHIGTDAPLSDVESIAVVAEVLKKLKISNVTLSLNSVGDKETRQKYKEKLVEYFSRYENDLSLDSQRRLQANPLRILDSKDEKDQQIALEAPSILDHLTPSSHAFFDRVQEGLALLNIAYELDRMLVRGLDYYDHTTFEFKTCLDSQNSIAIVGGGRYNGLVEEMGGPSIPAVGWAFGIDRLMIACNYSDVPLAKKIAVLFINQEEENIALKLTHRLRDELQMAVLFPTDGSFIKRLKYSDKIGATCVVILGADEIQSNQAKLKFLYDIDSFQAGQEISIPMEQVIAFFHQNLHV